VRHAASVNVSYCFYLSNIVSLRRGGCKESAESVPQRQVDGP